MQTMSLSTGENRALPAVSTVLSVTVQGPAVDVSALLLGPNGKVRSDADLVFYNHPAQDGVSVDGPAVTADLMRLPADVHRVLVVVSVDPLQPGAVFTRAPQLTISQSGAPALLFTAPDFGAGETVVVLAELYRRGEGWKARAVGEGYASGLAGLATDYGVDIDPEPDAVPSVPVPAQRRTSPARPSVDLAKVERRLASSLQRARPARCSSTEGFRIAGQRST